VMEAPRKRGEGVNRSQTRKCGRCVSYLAELGGPGEEGSGDVCRALKKTQERPHLEEGRQDKKEGGED